MELENIVANTVYLKAREGEFSRPLKLPKWRFVRLPRGAAAPPSPVCPKTINDVSQNTLSPSLISFVQLSTMFFIYNLEN